MVRFLHTADIHLDSPLQGLESYEDAPAEEIRGATRRAFVNCIDLAIDEAVDFLLIAGDLYDGDWKDYNTGLFLVGQMGRLKQAGIAAFLVSGNHDAASQITRALPLPDNVTLFPADRPQSIRLESLGVVVHGQSYPTRAVSDNLAAHYPPALAGYFNIGLLHTSLNGREGHDSYAPCTVDQLRASGYDYWALGHVHRREIVAEDPWIVFPGNPQGRHVREVGAKGATLVSMANGRVDDLREVELDVLRWALCRIDLETCRTIPEVHEAIRRAFEREADRAGDRPVALRLILTGRTPVHSLLCERQAELTEEIRGLAAGLGRIWLERVKWQTGRPTDLAAGLEPDTAFTDLLHSVEPSGTTGQTLFELAPELAVLKSKLPPETFRAECFLDPDSPQTMAELRAAAQELLRAKLLRHGHAR